MLIASRPSLRHSALAIAALAAALVAALAAAPPAGAASKAKCAKEVIADWYDNGRVDKIYPLHCYREAIKILPVDVRDYSSARDDILRALAYAQQGKPDPGDSGSNGKPERQPERPRRRPGRPGGGNPGDPGESPVDTSGPSAVPIPLIVLAVIATLLLVLGAAGYFTRRAAGRRADDGGPPSVTCRGTASADRDPDDLGSASNARRASGSIGPVHFDAETRSKMPANRAFSFQPNGGLP